MLESWGGEGGGTRRQSWGAEETTIETSFSTADTLSNKIGGAASLLGPSRRDNVIANQMDRDIDKG